MQYTKDIRVIAQKAKLTSYEGVDGWLTLLHALRERLSGHQIEVRMQLKWQEGAAGFLLGILKTRTLGQTAYGTNFL